MTPIAFEESLTNILASLLKMAKETTYNNISDNYTFILNEIKNSDTNYFEGQRKRIKENNRQPKIDFKEVVKQLLKIYPNLHDINFYIHKSTKHLTHIDVRYYLKSSLGEEFEQKEKNNAQMIHCKISIPPYQSDKKEKFDINWEHQTISTRWKLYWAKKRQKNEIRKMRK
jgi:hypothetical protein